MFNVFYLRIMKKEYASPEAELLEVKIEENLLQATGGNSEGK